VPNNLSHPRSLRSRRAATAASLRCKLALGALSRRSGVLRLCRACARYSAHDATAALHGGPRSRFDALVAAGALLGGDAAQAAAADALQALHAALVAAPEQEQQQAWPWRTKAAAAPGNAGPRGVYLHGGVGRGKTALMDLFHASLPGSVPSERAHSHAWMLALHASLHAESRRGGAADPLARVAAGVAARARVLCLDELEVTDVADAVLLRRVYAALRAHGTVLVTTSNASPEQLYRGGLNRGELFAPFVHALRQSCNVVCLDGGQDYRTAVNAAPLLYALRAEEARLHRAWLALQPHAEPPHALAVPVPGAARSVLAPAARGRACRFTFAEVRPCCSHLFSSQRQLNTCALTRAPRPRACSCAARR
jgi:cell division protein ZapE